MEENLTEEAVMAEVQRICEPDFFETHQAALQKETKDSVTLVLGLGIEILDDAFLWNSDITSVGHRRIREVYMNHWWQRLIWGRKRAMRVLEELSEKDRISQIVHQAIHRLLKSEFLSE